MASANLFTVLLARQKFLTLWCVETAVRSSAANVERRWKRLMSWGSDEENGIRGTGNGIRDSEEIQIWSV
jgi:hypothetical protein